MRAVDEKLIITELGPYTHGKIKQKIYIYMSYAHVR